MFEGRYVSKGVGEKISVGDELGSALRAKLCKGIARTKYLSQDRPDLPAEPNVILQQDANSRECAYFAATRAQIPEVQKMLRATADESVARPTLRRRHAGRQWIVGYLAQTRNGAT